MATLALEQVSKVYPNGVHAVNGLTLRISEGELVVVVGPSGCGKTTTLRLLAGLETPTAGNIFVGGRSVNALPPHERDVAMVFQKPALYPHFSVRRNLGFGPRMRNEATSAPGLLEERIRETARLLGLENVLDRLPGQLSGGQQQRVALGRALIRQPAFFLLDEPLGHLDAGAKAQLRQELHLLQRRLRATMVYVTHDQAEAMLLADRVAVMNQGFIQQADSPLRVYRQPCNRFVAGFIGWPAMNFLDGRVETGTAGVVYSTPPWSLPVPDAEQARWLSQAGNDLVLGIRPEHVRLSSPGASSSSMTMEVVLVESAGDAALVTCERDGRLVTARSCGQARISRQMIVEVSFCMEHAHLFDQKTGLALSHGTPDG